MSDTDTPGEQQISPAGNIDWEARYKGASTVINRLTAEKQQIETQLKDLASQAEQLRTSLGVKDVEKDTAITSYRTQLETAIRDKDTASRELTDLRAMRAKLEVAKKLNAHHLMPILDKIPYVENPQALEELVKGFVDWGQSLVQEREKEIRAGVTPPAASSAPAQTMPSTIKGWDEYVNSFPAGSPEKAKAMDAWWKWGQSQK